MSTPVGFQHIAGVPMACFVTALHKQGPVAAKLCKMAIQLRMVIDPV
ncbi:MAG: hypothetical protein ACR2GP_00855 [Burkholderiaceae bacterium]